jgi:hypothetical protein
MCQQPSFERFLTANSMQRFHHLETAGVISMRVKKLLSPSLPRLPWVLHANRKYTDRRLNEDVEIIAGNHPDQ